MIFPSSVLSVLVSKIYRQLESTHNCLAPSILAGRLHFNPRLGVTNQIQIYHGMPQLYQWFVWAVTLNIYRFLELFSKYLISSDISQPVERNLHNSQFTIYPAKYRWCHGQIIAHFRLDSTRPGELYMAHQTLLSLCLHGPLLMTWIKLNLIMDK